jgi:hypothetical protein
MFTSDGMQAVGERDCVVAGGQRCAAAGADCGHMLQLVLLPLVLLQLVLLCGMRALRLHRQRWWLGGLSMCVAH